MADDRHHGDKVNGHEDQDVGHNKPNVPHRQRGLHDLGRHPTGEFVLVEMHALTEHQPMEMPTQTHGEVAG